MSKITVQPKIVKVSPTPDGVSVKVVKKQVAVNIQQGPVVYNTGGGTATLTASENLGGHRVVTVEGLYASKDTSSDKFKILGVTMGAVNNGESSTVTTHGTITESSWNWTVGSPIFLSTNGQLTQTPPTSGFRIIIGIPRTATSMFVNISEPLIKI